MDVDNNSVEAQTGGGGAIDIEQSLLHQFSCMGTTDKDELVSQFQKLLGTQLNYSTAAFFLDMNNWNLQASICSYFDVENSSKLPSMTLVSNPQACESENIETNKSFTKVWNIVNSGTETWPEGCYAQIAAGDLLKSEKVPVPCLAPGQNGVLIVTMQSPQTPGTYQSKWRLCTRSGSYFGDPMWVILTVVEESTMALTNQLSHLSDLGATPAHSVPVNPFRTTEHLQGGSTDSDTHMC